MLWRKSRTSLTYTSPSASLSILSNISSYSSWAPIQFSHTQNRRHNKYLEPFHCEDTIKYSSQKYSMSNLRILWRKKTIFGKVNLIPHYNSDQMTNWMIPDWGDRCHLSLAWWQWLWCPPQYPLKTTQQIQTCLEHLSILHLNCLSVSNSSLQWAKLRQNHCYPVDTFWLSCYSWYSWYFVQLYK